MHGVPQNMQTGKLERYGTVRWRRNWLDGHILGPVLCNIFTSDTENWIKYTLSEFADNIKVSGTTNLLEG